MKYFADYMKERVYAVDEKTGDCVMKNERGVCNIRVDTENIPWLSEENGIGFLVEEMAKSGNGEHIHLQTKNKNTRGATL